jgi:hypothetical protein
MRDNAARVDELWDPSVSTEQFEPFLETNKALQAVLATARQPVRRPEPQELEFLGEKIVWTRDGNREFPAPVIDVLTQIETFASLPQGWDSYNGGPTELPAVRPALELIFETHRRCHNARAVPLSGGGIGLRWTSQTFAFEADIWSANEVEASLTNLETAEEEDSGTDLTGIRPLLDRFLSQP